MFRTLFLCLSLWSFSPLFAQQHPFIQYNTRNGLSQSQVRSIAQDSSGFLWFGTVGGVSRFDGKEFRNFSKIDGLPDPQIQDIEVAPDGTVWLATNKGIAYFTGDSLRLADVPDSLVGLRTNALCADESGAMLAAIHKRGLFRITHEHVEKITAYSVRNDVRVHCMERIHDGSLLVGTRTGLYNIKGDSTNIIKVGDHREKSISSIALHSDGKLWVSTYGDGIFRMNGNGTFKNFTEVDGLLQNNIRSLAIDRKGQIWAATKFGLNLIEGEDVLSFTIYRGMPNDNIWTAFEDNEGSIWLGTDGAGVLKYSGNRFVSYTVNDGLCSDLVMCTIADDRGDLWLGTYGNGVCRMDGMAMINTLDGLPNNTVWSGVHAGNGILYFGTSDGIARINKGVVEPFGTGSAVDRTRVFTMAIDADGIIWCGTRKGAAIIKPNGEVVDLNVPVRSVRKIIHVNDTLTYMCGADGVLQTGLKTEKLYTEKDGLNSTNVLCAALDNKQRLWAGTVSGLNCFTDTGIVTIQLGPDYGSNYINLLNMSADGIMSVGTNNGLYMGKVEAILSGNRAEQFTEADGLRTGEFNLNSTYSDSLGRQWFGTTGGLLLHDPKSRSSRHQTKTPQVHITRVRSFLKQSAWRKESAGIDKHTGLPIDLKIQHGKNYLTFDYVGINHAESEKVEYRYKLLGHDDDWLPVTKARFASYSSLRYGDYTFMVKAKVPGSVWSAPSTFAFEVLKPFWLSWWFIFLSVIIVALSIYGITKWRASQREAAEKTKQLMLRSRMLQLEQQALNANMNRHFVFNALNSIQFYINKQEKARANKYLTSFAKLIRKNLDNSQSDMTTLAEELERLELYLELEHMRFEEKFDYTLEIATGLDLIGVPIPAMMLQPYVENSIWHGILPSERHGIVAISVKGTNEGRIQVEIVDNGIGIDTSLAKKPEGDHISKGIEITKGRADVLRRMNRTDIRIEGPHQLHTSEGGTKTGTRVAINLPIDTVPRSKA